MKHSFNSSGRRDKLDAHTANQCELVLPSIWVQQRCLRPKSTAERGDGELGESIKAITGLSTYQTQGLKAILMKGSPC